MQERTVLGGMDLKAYLVRLRQNPKYTEEIIRLIEDDLRFGLTKEETEEYSSGRYDYRQMCVYSRCLRNGYGKEERAVLLKEGLSGEQMAVALEFYEKGVPLQTITEVISSGENTAYTMKRLFAQALLRIKEAESVSEQDMAYAKELVAQMQEVVKKISYQEKRYDALNEKLKEIGTASQDAQIQNNLLVQLSEKDGLLKKQQNELNEAKRTIAELSEKLEEMDRERKEVKGQIKKDDGVLSFIPVERMERKDRKRMMSVVCSCLFFKQKTDIVKLLAQKDLSPAQLVQVRSAIEKGLSEKQLLVLINSKIPAEQMEEIINIAVYENQMSEVR